MNWKEIAENCGQMIREIALTLDDTEKRFNTHSQDECNQALSEFYDRIRAIIYPKENLK